MRRRILIVLFMFVAFGLYAQHKLSDTYLQAALAGSFLGEDLDDGRTYHANLLKLRYAHALTRDNERIQFNLISEAHFGLNNIRTEGNRDFELAYASGFELLYKLPSRFSFTMTVVSGPGFVSAKTEKQHRGFLFTNNFAGGVLIPLKNQDWMLRLEYRFRHMSNLGILSPNAGYDNHFFLVGVARLLNKAT